MNLLNLLEINIIRTRMILCGKFSALGSPCTAYSGCSLNLGFGRHPAWAWSKVNDLWGAWIRRHSWWAAQADDR